MARPTIYHNPRCSKSRQTLALLEERGLDPLIVDYLKAPPSAVELQAILKKLKMKPRDLMRKGEAVYKELRLDNEKLTDEKLVRAMEENPILIERPIVVMGAKARIGRPPESVLEIL
ncbi:arsenate reductase (glutaredoxin) [Parvibaculum sp.]|uniref:arsenate reductase (glutaredoxin) n=1 Tax=Parvibaculum sp. TaxID=2024848 RepID=UPI0039197BA9